MANENTVKAGIRRQCRRAGVFVKAIPAGEFSVGGISDFIACVCGRYVAIEAKANKDRNTTALQAEFLREVLDNGGAVAVVDDSNVDGLATWLSGLCNNPRTDSVYIRKPRDLDGPRVKRIVTGG